jgi:hypothetical protein
MLPPDLRQYAPHGNVLVIKHEVSDTSVPIQDLPVVNALPADYACINDLLRR